MQTVIYCWTFAVAPILSPLPLLSKVEGHVPLHYGSGAFASL